MAGILTFSVLLAFSDSEVSSTFVASAARSEVERLGGVAGLESAAISRCSRQ